MCTVLLVAFSTLLLSTGHAQDRLPDGVFPSANDCAAKCSGLRDLGCKTSTTDSNNRAYCQCIAGYFNNEDQCTNECDNVQYWSLFTYGDCASITTTSAFKNVIGSCNFMCVFKVRVWATVFIIILFVSAVTLLILMLPGFVTSCYTCCFLQKAKRRNEEDVAIASIQDPHGTVSKGQAQHQQMAMHQGGWQYPFYGWPYYGQQGR